MDVVSGLVQESGDDLFSRERWLARVVTGPASPRLLWAEAQLRGGDPDAKRAWTRFAALVATQHPVAVMEAPRLAGRTGALVVGVAVARSGELLEGAEILEEVISDARLSAVPGS
jgi:hypothetical protein